MPLSETFSIQTRSKNRELMETSMHQADDIKAAFNQFKTTVNLGSRPRSVSFSTPEFREGSKSSEGSSPDSPLRMRPHTSESGSPTLEQALLMGRDSPGSDAGYGSFQSGFLSTADAMRRQADNESPSSQPTDRSYSPGEPRPTLATLVEADLAVAQAAQNLQDLKEKQAAIYEEMKMSQAAKDNSILSVLLASTQGSKGFDNQLYEPRDMPEKFLRDGFLDKDLRSAFDNVDPFSKTRDPLALERAARQYRNAASMSEANGTWTGQLLPKHQAGRNSSYSSKIFLGGVPWDITEMALIQAFKDFGPVRVEWPGKDTNPTPKGYMYIVFEDEDRVKELLGQCAQDFSNGGSYYYKIASQKRGLKEIQIIPWLVEDSTYIGYPSPQLDPKKTVFVGALHGMMNAQSLALIFNDLFGNVVFAGLDTDKYKYPIGSGRVTFSSTKSFRKAVKAAFIEIKTSRFQKKIQVDPYLEDAICSICQIKQGPYFCREERCFSYYCRGCWERMHVSLPNHKPLMRNIRGLTRARLQDFMPSECYSSTYPGVRDSKLFMDYWGEFDQDKRPEVDNWRCSDRSQQVWRRGNNSFLDRNQELGTDTPWRSHEREPSWMNNSEYTWEDDQSKLSAVFADTLNLGIGERSSGLKPFFDTEQFPKLSRDHGFDSFRPGKGFRDASSGGVIGGVGSQIDRELGGIGESGHMDRFGFRTGGGAAFDRPDFSIKGIIGSGGILSSDDAKSSDT